MIERYFLDQSMKKIELENFFKRQLDKAGFTGLEIVKTPMVTRIVLSVARPGLAIGKGGQNIRALTEDISRKFKIDNPQIEISELKNSSLDAKNVADRIKVLLERGFSWRSVIFKVVNEVMHAKAKGVELLLSGKLAGKGGRKAKKRVAYGYMKKVGEQAKLVDYAKVTAYPKPGAIGIKLRIIAPGVEFPDKASIRPAVDKKKASMLLAKENAIEEKVEIEEEEPKKEKAKKEKVKKEKAEKKEKEHADEDEKEKPADDAVVEKNEKLKEKAEKKEKEEKHRKKEAETE